MGRRFRILVGVFVAMVATSGALAGAAEADSSTKPPSFGKIKVKRGKFWLMPKSTRATVRVQVAGAGRVVIETQNGRFEADPGKRSKCGDTACRWWYIQVDNFPSKKPIFRGGLSYRITATNQAGTRTIFGDRCKRSWWCRPHRVNCSTLTSEGWKKAQKEKASGTARQGFAYGLERCRTLVGLDREALYQFMGEPERSGKRWASWSIGYNMLGDERRITAELRMGRVVRVS